jgi:hypothetical protein
MGCANAGNVKTPGRCSDADDDDADFSMAEIEVSSVRSRIVLQAVEKTRDSLEVSPSQEKWRDCAAEVLTNYYCNCNGKCAEPPLFKEYIRDRAIVLKAVGLNGMFLQACRSFWSDRQVVLQAVKSNGLALQFADSRLRMDLDILEVALTNNPDAIHYAPRDLMSDRDAALRLVRCHGLVLKFFCRELRFDRDVVLAAVRQNGLALACASEALQGDREVAHAAVCSNGLAMRYIKPDLRYDREIALDAVESNEMAMEFLPGILLHDSEIVVAGGSYLSWAMPSIMKKLGKDRDFVLACVGKDGLSLKYAATHYKCDFEIVSIAVQQNARAIRFAHHTLQDDPDIMESAVQACPKLIQCSRTLAMSKRFILRAVHANARIIHYMSPELITDEEFLIQVVAEAPITLCLTQFGNSRDFVLEAVKRNPAVLEYAALSLQDDKEILMAVELQSESDDKQSKISCVTNISTRSTNTSTRSTSSRCRGSSNDASDPTDSWSTSASFRSATKSVRFDIDEPKPCRDAASSEV